jgi:predicted nucleic acid-binding protein
MPSFTRAELHELVWTEPRVALAKRLGVSDVWIGKACLRANIPVPGRGHWARLAAGQKVSREVLPRRGLGQADRVTLGPDPERWSHRPDAEIVVPPEIHFDESIEVIRARATKEVGRVVVPRSFEGAARAVAGILLEDEERRRTLAEDRFSWKKPRFEVPAAIRRLKIINALTLGLARAGYSSSVNPDDLSVWVSVGCMGVSLKLSAITSRKSTNQHDPLQLVDDKSERLQLEICTGGFETAAPGPWRDTDDAKLESQLTEVAIEILVCGEFRYRSETARRRSWAQDRVREREEAAQKKRLELEAQERARLARIEKSRLDHLLGLAKGLEQSEQIRALVAAMADRAGSDSDVANWSDWALHVADSLDPRLMNKAQLTWAPREAG